ncbi:hypothetical protein MGU_04320 [Metarhizium guizhouense ARSEF 977]|uniref:Uncharacterized protein n=1 Tax=Metarhizium guizhouense (strain ARSEF 977) TaxID=1276136 RepID=A0A0B4HA61_METGA|nr:hypothetical protein MGU_04320 [Metarhizium guizhouense ARSEF 977]
MSKGRRVPCFHRDCYSVKLLPISSNFLAAIDYVFSPPIHFELERQQRIKRTLARNLGLGFLHQLPQELCHMVAGYLYRQWAAIACQDVARHLYPSDSTIHLTQDVYATYVTIEGISYLQSLENSPLENAAKGHRILDVPQGHTIRTIYVAYDHVGIRNIYFELPKRDDRCNLSLDCGRVWWKQLTRDFGLVRIVTESDGLKIRRLLDSTDPPVSRSDSPLDQAWPTPGLSCRLIDLDTCGSAKGLPDNLRMSFIDCNTPGTNGYSAAISGFHILKMYAHGLDTTTQFDLDMDDDASSVLWMYMPIDADEYLEQVWAVKHPESGFLGLMLYSSQGRAVMFGSYNVHPGLRLQFHLIYRTTKSPSRIYINDWDPLCDDKRIKYLGIESTNDEDSVPENIDQRYRETYPPPIRPSSSPPYTQYNELWYYTNCRLDNVVGIACCIDKGVSHKPIIGILIHYGDGRRACVGQYRFDWALDLLAAESSRSLRIGLGKTRKNFP